MQYKSTTYVIILLTFFLNISIGATKDEKDRKKTTIQNDKSLNKPSVSPQKTIFTNSIKVTLSQSCKDACCKKSDIVYTLDGSDPRKSSSGVVYTRPISITGSVILKAYSRAYNNCRKDSDLLIIKYSRIDPLPLPNATPENGKLVFDRKIGLFVKGFEGDTTVRIFYSTDGSDPSTTGKVYETPFTVQRSSIVRAIAVSTTGQYLNSPILYTYFECVEAVLPEPKAVPSSNNFRKNISVSLFIPGFEEKDSVSIHYTLDGSEPGCTSKKYSAPIALDRTTELKAIAVKNGYRQSRVAEEIYSHGLQPVAPKAEISQKGGVYKGEIPLITLSCSLKNAMIMYTLDGSEPTLASNLWDNKPFRLIEPTTLKVKVFKLDWIPSVTVTETYEFDTLPGPVANYSTGVIFNDSLTIKLTIPEVADKTGLRTYYTLDGSDPGKHGRLYNNPFTLHNSCIVKTFACKQGYHDSKIKTFEYFNMLKVTHAYYQDRDRDGKIDAAILHFNKPLQMLPSFIEFTNPFTGEKRRIESSDITGLNPESAEKHIEVIFKRPFRGVGGFNSGHYGRIPLPGEFDTAPFLINDSTNARHLFPVSRKKKTGTFHVDNLKFNSNNISVITNPFVPGQSRLPRYIRQLGDLSSATGTAIVIKPQRPSTGVAYFYDALKNQEVLTKSLVEDPSTGILYLIWDGRNRQGHIVARGVYLVLMKIKEKQSGEVVSHKVNIAVKR